MDQLLLRLPFQFQQIIEQVKNQDWLICNFDVSKDALYNPAGYIYNNDLNGTQYKIILDRNVFRFIVSSAKGIVPNEKQRAAISLVCFCQIANIDFEPNLAVYERLLPQKNNAQNAVDELILFNKINNSPNDSLISFSLSESNYLELYPGSPWDADKLQKQLTKYQWLTEWKSLYLIILKIVYFNSLKISSKSKLTEFIKWLVKDFRLSAVSIVFAIFLFSSVRLKNMVKLKSSSKKGDKLKQLYNMTWDLFFMNNYIRLLINKDDRSEILLATDDKIIKQVLRATLDVQNAGSLSKLKSYLPIKEHVLVNIVEDEIENTEDRVYDSIEWSMDYREELIREVEQVVLSI